jgi:hypothetical protein
LTAGAHDRIIVQNNSVNLIDPYGLNPGLLLLRVTWQVLNPLTAPKADWSELDQLKWKLQQDQKYEDAYWEEVLNRLDSPEVKELIEKLQQRQIEYNEMMNNSECK